MATVSHSDLVRYAEKSRADIEALAAAVQGSLKTRTAALLERMPERKPKLLRKIFSASFRWQEKYGYHVGLSNIMSADETAPRYNLVAQLTFPALFRDKVVQMSLSVTIGTPWYERFDILSGRIRTHNAVAYSSDIIKASQSGNISLLRMLLTHGRGSITDSTPDMRPLLWVCDAVFQYKQSGSMRIIS